MTQINRRNLMAFGLASITLPSAGFAASPWEIGWDDLIPPGIPYAEIIGEGDLDTANDTWRPIYDANGEKLNPKLDGAYIRMPGFIVPLDVSRKGVREFILVPYQGACIHTPPPPANQLVLANTQTPWPADRLWDAVWVVGWMKTQINDTDIAETGYTLDIESIEIYEW